jgi:hypothetical protein
VLELRQQHRLRVGNSRKGATDPRNDVAVLAECLNVIVPVGTLEERYPGGVKGYELSCPNQTFCRDQHLTRVGFMSPADLERFVASITTSTALTLRDEGGFVDIAVVDMIGGPTAPCSWLEFDDLDGCPQCWLTGTEPGVLAAPAYG